MLGRMAKVPNVATATAVALATTLVLQGRPAGASEFSDFRIPENRWYTLGGSLSSSGSFRKLQGASHSDGASSVGLSGSVFGTWGLDADDRSYSVSASTGIGGSRMREDRSIGAPPTPFSVLVHDRWRTRSTRTFADARFLHHLFGWPLSLGVGGRATVLGDRRWHERFATQSLTEGVRVESEDFERAHYYQHEISGSAEAGWGRLRNATGVFEAELLERRLRRTGALEGSLSPETRRRIAALYYLRSGFGVAHWRPTRYFWREVERVLREDEALSDRGLDAFDWFRVNEPHAGQMLRFVGTRVAGIVEIVNRNGFVDNRVEGRQSQYAADTLFSQTIIRYGSVDGRRTEAILAGVEAQLHRPLGFNWQLDADVRAVSPPRDFGDALDVSSQATIAWYVADRWRITGSVGQARRIEEPIGDRGRPSQWLSLYRASLEFYAEDRLTFELTADRGERAVRHLNGREYNHFGGVNLGLTYRFLGAFDAPGSIEPMRSLPLSGAERSW